KIMTQNCGSATLNASGGNCTITVNAMPTSTGSKTATLKCTDGGSNTAVVTLTATVLGKLGDPCVGTSNCGTGTCVDSRCCNSSSCPSCKACNVDSSGTCKPVGAGTVDPRGVCVNAPSNCTLNTCDGAGACAFVAANTTCSTTCSNDPDSGGQYAAAHF